MAVRKEIAFFLAFAALLGWRATSLVSSGEVAPRGTRGKRAGGLDYVAQPVPDAALALPVPRAARLSRDLFSPPRDTEPLPPLGLELPPIEPLEVLGPPTAWGPLPATLGRYARRSRAVVEVPALFDLASEEETVEEPGGEDAGAAALTALDPASRLEEVDAYKRQYDWVLNPDLRFGYIKNANRYDLLDNDEAIQFVEIDTTTGAPRWANAIVYERDRGIEFGFADTAANRIELRSREFSDPLRPAELDQAIAFAEECVALRNEAPRALEIAEQMFHRAERVGTDSVRALLGLGRCYELAFRFDDALTVYLGLVQGEHQARAEPWARLGELYARFRLNERAEEALRTGVAKSRTSWEARLAYGRFLAAEERFEEAHQVLSEALAREPGEPSLRDARVAIRSELARTAVALGRLDEAAELFQRTRSADPDYDLGLAGMVSLAALRGGGLPDDEGLSGPDASFDLLFARGLAATYAGAWQAARRDLELALAADPFRAALPLRTLSWLADATGHPEEALAFVERALESRPRDPWSLYQRGRLLADIDDPEGAMESFRRALDRELDFPDVLIAMGQLSQKGGRHEDAERYYERALMLDDARPAVHSLRGFNHLALGAVVEAGDDFRAALRLDPDLASAANGLAWWSYARGDSGEALTLFAELADRRRNAPAGDPHRAYAEAQKDRILDHESKEVWSDRFDRVGRIQNDWKYDEGLGPIVDLAEGAVRIAGQFAKEGRTRLYRELPADRFLALEATVTIGVDSGAITAGFFVAREVRGSAGDSRTYAALELVRNGSDGRVQARITKRGVEEPALRDLTAFTWPLGQPVRLRLERRGETTDDTTITFWMDDVPVLENAPVQSLGRSNQALRFGVFAEGKSGRVVDVLIDDVRVVRRRQ